MKWVDEIQNELGYEQIQKPPHGGLQNDSTWPGNPKKTHQKGGMEGITQARGRVKVCTVCCDTNSKVGGSIAICLIEF